MIGIERAADTLRWFELRGPERKIAIGLAVTLAVGFIAIAYRLQQRVDRFIGSNAVGIGAPIATIGTDDEYCVNSLIVPGDTARLRLFLGATRKPAVGEFTLDFPDTASPPIRITKPIGEPAGQQFVELPTAVAHERRAVLCMRAGQGEYQLGGATTFRLPGERPSTLNGKSLPAPLDVTEPSVHFYTSDADNPRRWQLLAEVLDRIWVWQGKWYAFLALAITLAALSGIVTALWVLVTAERRTIRNNAIALGAVGILMAGWWAVVAPTFQGPDEPEHYAFVQYLGETGNHPTASYLNNKLPPYSTQQQRFMDAFHQNSVVVDGTVRPFFTTTRVADWRRLDRDLPRADGGGYTIAGTGHSSLYYAPLAVVYRATRGMEIPRQVLVLRLFSALFVGLIPFLVVLTAGLLFAGRAYPAAAAGTLVALHPMVGHIGGSINNDTAINVTGALVLYLAMKTAIDGWSSRRAVALGATAVVAPILKLSGAAQAGFAALATLLTLLRDRSLDALKGSVATVVGVVGACAVWIALTSVAGQPTTLVNQHTDVGAVPPEWIPTFMERIDYIVQTVIPSLHLVGEQQPQTVPLWRIYGVGGWATFGWTRINFSIPVYKGLALIWLAAVILGAIAMIRHRKWLSQNWLPVTFVFALPVLVVAAVGWAYAVPGGRLILAEQGRYILPAVGALSIAMAGSVFGLPAKLRHYGWGAIGGFIAAFTVASGVLAIGGWYA